MSGLLKKIRDMISPSHADSAADAAEEHLNEERVDSVLGRVPGGSSLTDKTPDDLNTRAGDAIRDNLGDDTTDKRDKPVV